MRLRSHTKILDSNESEEEQQIDLEQILDKEDEHEDEDMKKDEIVKPLTLQKLTEFEKEQNKTGLVYLSRIPPFMKPAKIKNLLSKFGEVGRVYLAPEDPKIKARRIKYKGHRKQNYTEGWVEFMDKKVAKTVATALNTQPIGGNKRNFYHDDLWNIKYLPKFKWNNLTEQIVYENRERTHRLQAEISKSRKEIKDYVKKVEKSKMIRNIEEKKAKKRMTINSESLS
ncbi:1896_t:CDS:2 [Cetraspora pellucida]|uniref:1896_t:CDS:1 n=1 Tax=Cetraspora pellucida TaxID=1433469 RepID=A0ACA9L165_9GLOM|nr:1896_t:CDS:2 [Cetraspora pellucida]